MENWSRRIECCPPSPPHHPSIPYLCTNVGRPHIQRSVLEPWHPSLVKSNQILDTLQEDLFIKFLMLQQCYHTSLPNKKIHHLLYFIYYISPLHACFYSNRWVLFSIPVLSVQKVGFNCDISKGYKGICGS